MKYPLGFNTWSEQEKKSAKKIINTLNLLKTTYDYIFTT